MNTLRIKGKELSSENVIVYGENEMHIDHISEIVGQNKRIIWFDNGSFTSIGHTDDVIVLGTTDGF